MVRAGKIQNRLCSYIHTLLNSPAMYNVHQGTLVHVTEKSAAVNPQIIMTFLEH